MIWLAGWIVGERLLFPRSQFIWAGKLPSNFSGASSGHPIPVGQTGVANFPRICTQGPLGPTTIWPLAYKGQGRWSADHLSDAEPRWALCAPCTALSRDHLISQPSRSKGAPVDAPGEAVLF